MTWFLFAVPALSSEADDYDLLSQVEALEASQPKQSLVSHDKTKPTSISTLPEKTKPTSAEKTKPTSAEKTKPTSAEKTKPTSAEKTKPTSAPVTVEAPTQSQAEKSLSVTLSQIGTDLLKCALKDLLSLHHLLEIVFYISTYMYMYHLFIEHSQN